MKAWFDEPQELLNVDKVSEFWPTGEQTPEDRVNATSRFVIYTTCILYITRRDPRVFVLGATVLSVVYVLYKSKMVKEGYGMKTVCGQKCQRPTQDNPMGNVLMSDYVDAPNRLEACYYATVKPNAGATVSYDSGRSRSPLPKYQRNGLTRQFISNPVTKIPGDQTAFAEWLYGPKNGPMCKSNTRFCDPNARGVQLEAFAGIGHDGDIRGPRGGTYS